MGTPVKLISPDSKYSPISVSQSPVVKVQGNLTGTVRQIRDTVADLYNLIQKWNNSYLQGINILQDIIDLKLASFSRAGDINIYPKGLERKSEELDGVYNGLVTILKKMKALGEYLKGVRKFEERKNNCSEPLFLTWPTEKFELEGTIIVKAYEDELKVKQQVKENVCHSESKNSLLCFLPLWVHQCYVNNDINFRLEAMLKECGHR